MLKVLRVKAKMAVGELKGIPVLGRVLLCGILILIVYSLVLFNETHEYIVFGAVSLLLLYFHQNRKDCVFCKVTLDYPHLFFAVEYFIITLPFSVLSVVYGAYDLSIAYLLIPPVAAVIPQIRIHLFHYSKPFVISNPSLESVSFFRRYHIIFYALYLASLVLSMTSRASMFLVYFMILFYAGTAFSQCESLTVLCLKEKPSESFLKSIIWDEIVFWIKIFLPIFVLYMIFNSETAYLVLLPMVLGPLCIITCVSIKYSGYSPSRHYSGSASQAICLLGYILPLLLPVSVFMTIAHYRMALDNLKQYLDDYYK